MKIEDLRNRIRIQQVEIDDTMTTITTDDY